MEGFPAGSLKGGEVSTVAASKPCWLMNHPSQMPSIGTSGVTSRNLGCFSLLGWNSWVSTNAPKGLVGGNTDWEQAQLNTTDRREARIDPESIKIRTILLRHEVLGLHFPRLVRWCNGSTRPFGGFGQGSNPCRTANFPFRSHHSKEAFQRPSPSHRSIGFLLRLLNGSVPIPLG